MKQFKKTIVAGITAGILSLSIVATGDLLAHGRGYRGGGMGQGWNAQGQTQNVRPGWIMRDELRQAQMEILSEMSGQSVDELNGKLEYKPLWAVLDEYKVDFKEFRAKMHEKHIALVEKAAADGKITEAQKTMILERMTANQSQQPGFGKGGFGKGGGFGHRGPRGPRGGGMGRGFGMGFGYGGQMPPQDQMPNNLDKGADPESGSSN